MRAINVEEITRDDILAFNLYDGLGRTLLQKGARLRASYIDRLKSQGVDSVYIEDKLSEGIIVEEFAVLEMKQQSKLIMNKEFTSFCKTKKINVAQMYKVVDLILNDILGSNKDFLLNIKDLRLKDDKLLSHSLSVAIMSALLCKSYDLNYEKTRNVVVGCLLHDLGKLLIPGELLKKDSRKMNDDERAEYLLYPKIGYELLQGDIEISPTSRVIVLTHRERNDGSGPNGLTSTQINKESKICALCDTFDELIHGGGSDNSLLNTSEAIEYVSSLSNIYFDKEMVQKLLNHIPSFQNGSIVLLNNGLVGIVVRNNKDFILRPVVRIFYDSIKKEKTKIKEIDLMTTLNLKIDKEIGLNMCKI
jgi:HD-GYP domain-containing protein (c-di-GMP phosphodiesterase class II)